MASANTKQISLRIENAVATKTINIIMKRSDFMANFLSLNSKIEYGDLGQNTEVNNKKKRIK